MSKKIVFFDGICLLCNGLVDFLIRHDRKQKLFFSPLQSGFSQKTFPHGDLNTVYFYDGFNYYSKSDAIIKMLYELGSYFKLSIIFFLLPKFLRDKIYDLVAKNRYKIWGKHQVCRMPKVEEKDRFII